MRVTSILPKINSSFAAPAGDLEWVAKTNGFTALRAGGDHIDGTLGDVLEVLEITLGFYRKLFIRGCAGGRGGPTLECFVHWLTVGQRLEIERHISIELPMISIPSADLEFLTAVEHVQFRDGQ